MHLIVINIDMNDSPLPQFPYLLICLILKKCLLIVYKKQVSTHVLLKKN